MTRIVTTHYCYKRPPRKRPKAAALDDPAIVTRKGAAAQTGKAAAQFFLNYPAGATGRRNPAHRPIQNVTAP
jgi:hypothetical protein